MAGLISEEDAGYLLLQQSAIAMLHRQGIQSIMTTGQAGQESPGDTRSDASVRSS
jgi:hypothetical protein